MIKRKGTLFVLAGIFIGILLAFLFRNPSLESNQSASISRTPFSGGNVNVNFPAPGFTLSDINGNPVSLEEWRGRVVLLNFWTTWCTACKEEMPALEDLYHNTAGELVVLGIDVGENASQVVDFTMDTPVAYPLLLDIDRFASTLYQVQGFPTTYFLDKEGIIRAKHVGALTPRLLEQYLIPLGLDL